MNDIIEHLIPAGGVILIFACFVTLAFGWIVFCYTISDGANWGLLLAFAPFAIGGWILVAADMAGMIG